MSAICLDTLGYDERYILFSDGNIYDKYRAVYLKHSGEHYIYSLQLASGEYVNRSLKPLYKQAFNKVYCIDKIPDLDGEEWRQVVIDKNTSFDTSCYYVSNKGRIKSLVGYNAKILKQFVINGYSLVKINNKNYRVHRLVALAFIPNDDKTKDTVDHIDGNKQNNTVANLQWLSRLDNIKKYNETKQQDKENIQSNH